MLSVKLPDSLEEELNNLAEVEGSTKTDIVTNALENYIKEHKKKTKPYKLGVDLFDTAGTGDADASTDYKEKVGEKINKKRCYNKINLYSRRK